MANLVFMQKFIAGGSERQCNYPFLPASCTIASCPVYETAPLSVTRTVAIRLRAVALAGRRGGRQGREKERPCREMIRLIEHIFF